MNMSKRKVIFDTPAACAVQSLVAGYLTKCGQCSKRDTNQCFREPLLRGLKSLNNMEIYNDD